MRKILIIFSLVCVLGLTFSVYADDLEESSDSSGDSVVPIELEDDFRRTAENIYLVLSDNGTRATPHDVNDVYNLIVQIFYNQSNGSNEVVVIRQKLTSIDTACATIMSNVSSINTSLSNFYDSINPDYDQTGISIYDLIHTFYDSIFDIDGTDGDISLMELILVIEDEIENVELQLNSIISSVSSIDSKCSTISSTLNTLNTNIINIYSAIQNQSSLLDGDLDELNANAQLIISRLQSFENNFNNISWSTLSKDISYYSSLDNAKNSTNPISSGLYSDLYVRINTIYLYDNIYRFDFPILPYDVYNSIFINNLYLQANSGGGFYRIDLYNQLISSKYSYMTVLDTFSIPRTYASGVQNSNIILHITSSASIYYLNQDTTISYISFDSFDYYTVFNYLHSKHIDSIADKFEKLYASDDLIQAKEAQQDYEDDAINDFTGSGSAAASRGDLSNIKDVSTTIKQGLQTGGSVSNALSVFNSSGSFWGWFGSQNYNDINNLSSTPNNRSGSTSEPEVIDFYTNNQYTLQGLLNGGN